MGLDIHCTLAEDLTIYWTNAGNPLHSWAMFVSILELLQSATGFKPVGKLLAQMIERKIKEMWGKTRCGVTEEGCMYIGRDVGAGEGRRGGKGYSETRPVARRIKSSRGCQPPT